MNLAWIVQGIRDIKSVPIRNSMDKIYSLVSSDDSQDSGRSKGKRKRRDEVEDYDFNHSTTKRTGNEN